VSVLTPFGPSSLGVTGQATVLSVEVPAADPPPGISEQVITRASEVFNAPTVNTTTGRIQDRWEPVSVVTGAVGVIHTFFGNHDRTYFRGARTQVQSFEVMDPFGCGPATLRFPRVSALEDPGSGTLGWLVQGASVDIHLISGGGGRWILWSGTVVGFSPDGTSDGGTGLVVNCIGDLATGAMLQHHRPRQYVPLTDRGVLLARAFNEEVVSPRIGTLITTTTGHSTTERGSSDQMIQEYAQAILPPPWTIGRTAAQRVYQLRLRSAPGHVHRYTVRALQRGVDIDLSLDYTQAPNLIFGRGVNAKGYAWANWRYPGQDGTSQPPYPMGSPSATIHIGMSDADTASGDGVSQVQERINELNLSDDVRVDGVFSASDEDAVRDVQRHLGIQVDGVVAGQTWNAMWPLYTSDQLDKAVRLSLAGDNRVVPYSYAADGTILGANGNYDPSILRVERDEQMGSGVSKAVGIRSASDEYQRTRRGGEAYPGWVGTIRFKADPQELSRFRITEEDEIQVLGWAGADPVLHVASVQFSPEDGAGEVTCTVDELARDLPTIQAIIRQDEDSRDDPLRMPGRRARRTQINPDAVEPFDGESKAGIIPRIPLFSNLWTVQAVPVSAAGRMSKVTFKTTPAAEFYIAFFGDVVTSAQLVRYVGDPLVTDEFGRGPYQPNEDALADLGFIEAIGGPNQPGGYHPGQKTSPWDGVSSSPLTGRLESTAPINYRSVRPPWVWVAFYADRSTTISGRLLPAPIED
jgi:peptidoglycan hydrolase-like protein with peptidoglycan-binding domain